MEPRLYMNQLLKHHSDIVGIKCH